MPKELRQDNFRVEVSPDLFWNDTEKKAKRACDDIAVAIRRHIDDIGHVSVTSDDASVCSHCGAKWTEESSTYNGGCCDMDEEADHA